MIKKKMIILLVFFLLIGCSSRDLETQNPCFPPEGFLIDDLVGVWEYREYISPGVYSYDKLMIREDGYYKQILHLEKQNLDYESDWLPWTSEYTENGGVRIYLEGMNLCLYSEANYCESIDDTWDSAQGMYHCLDEYVMPESSGVLFVKTIYGGYPWYVEDHDQFVLSSVAVFTGGLGKNSYQKIGDIEK